MIGRGEAGAAISVRNALFDGHGAAIGVELTARASVRVGAESTADRPAGAERDPWIGAVVRAFLRRTGRPDEPIRVEVRSEIPRAAGLKSSSAVAGAVVRALLASLGERWDSEAVAKLLSDVGLAGGFSATGAFDDALAALSPGFFLTDNGTRRILRADPVPPLAAVVLWVPRRPHPASPLLLARFRARQAEAEASLAAARAGEWMHAMNQNSALVESTLGYPYAEVRQALGDAGAVASGVSGMGPAIAALVPHLDRLSPVLRALPRGGGDVIVTRLRNGPAAGAR